MPELPIQGNKAAHVFESVARGAVITIENVQTFDRSWMASPQSRSHHDNFLKAPLLFSVRMHDAQSWHSCIVSKIVMNSFAEAPGRPVESDTVSVKGRYERLRI